MQMNGIEYARRQPEKSDLYKIVSKSFQSFFRDRREEGRYFPEYIHKEFESYLKCGILSYGFVRLKCQNIECSKEKVVAFSCKKRGFCPSCASKRMVETSEHLMDNILPLVPYRQFVVTFPVPLRYLINSNKNLFKKVHKIVISLIHSHYTNSNKTHLAGSISFHQRFGSDLRLNPHLHILCPDGKYIKSKDNLRFSEGSLLTEKEVRDLLTAISAKIRKLLIRNGYLSESGDLVHNPLKDRIFEDYEGMESAAYNSMKGKIAFGENAGSFVTRLGMGFGYAEEVPKFKSKLCYSLHGFSIHAATRVNTHRRERLAKLVRYMSRGAVSNKRIKIVTEPSGHKWVRLKLKTPYSDGTTHLRFSFSEFIEKLV